MDTFLALTALVISYEPQPSVNQLELDGLECFTGPRALLNTIVFAGHFGHRIFVLFNYMCLPCLPLFTTPEASRLAIVVKLLAFEQQGPNKTSSDHAIRLEAIALRFLI